MTNMQLQNMYDQVKTMLVGWEAAKIKMVPKVHLLFHMVERAQHRGNSRFYGTFLDESLNKTLRDLVRVAHPNIWEQRIFQRFRLVEAKRTKRQKRLRE